MRIAIAQINTTVGAIQGNKNKIISFIHRAKNENVDLVLFPAFAITGYPPEDLLKSFSFCKLCEKALMEIVEETENIAVVIGNIETFDKKNDEIEPKFKLKNKVYFINNKKITSSRQETSFTKNIFFDPEDYFQIDDKEKESFSFTFKEKKFILSICNDLFDPIIIEKLNKVFDYFIHIDANPIENEGDVILPKMCANMYTQLFRSNFIFVNQVGANGSMIFSGKSFISDANNTILDLPAFDEVLKIVETDKIKQNQAEEFQNDISFIHDALVLGIKDYFVKSGLKKAVIGLSGGIDSAVVAALTVKALGNENVYGVLMPSKFSSNHSIVDAEDLANNLSIDYDIIPIEKMYDSAIDTLKPIFKDRAFDVTEENLQARIRSNILMAISNKFGYIVLNTSNKSESAVGYGTLYGDLSGAISVLGDVYKTDVFELANYINRKDEIIPYHTILKPPSAELRPNQKDSDTLPDYGFLDHVLIEYIENHKDIDDIVSSNQEFNRDEIEKIIKRVNSNEFKRRQAPPPLVLTRNQFVI